MKKFLKILIIVFAAAFLVSVVSSSVFERVESDHKCVGDECPVCAVLSVCSSLNRHLDAVATEVLTVVGMGFGIVALLASTNSVLFGKTLVDLKVKLSA